MKQKQSSINESILPVISFSHLEHCIIFHTFKNHAVITVFYKTLTCTIIEAIYAIKASLSNMIIQKSSQILSSFCGCLKFAWFAALIIELSFEFVNLCELIYPIEY